MIDRHTHINNNNTMKDKQEVLDELEKRSEQGHYKRTILNAVIAGSVVLSTTVVGAAIAWVVAPPVGGEWWPYIHVGIALVGAYVALQLLGVVAVLLANVVISDMENIENFEEDT